MAEPWIQHLVAGIKQKYHEAAEETARLEHEQEVVLQQGPAVWNSFVDFIAKYAHDAVDEFGQDVTLREGPLSVDVDSSGQLRLDKKAFPYVQFSAAPDYNGRTANICYARVNPKLEPNHTVRGTPIPCHFAVSQEDKVYLLLNGKACQEPQEAAKHVIEKLFHID